MGVFKLIQKLEFSAIPANATSRNNAPFRKFDISPAEVLEVTECMKSVAWGFELGANVVNYELRGGAVGTAKLVIIKVSGNAVLNLASTGRPSGDFRLVADRRSVIHGDFTNVRVSNLGTEPITVEAFVAGV